MGGQMKKIAILMLAACALVGQPNIVFAQNLNGIINLMGRAIENDMENKRRDRQRYLDHKAAENREKQQRNQERIAEIALVKRLQSGLQSLGFYTSKVDGDRGSGTRGAETRFTTAFGLPPLSLSENDVQLVERYAATGFRNREEVLNAQSGGFFDRGEMLSAQLGGFDNAAEYRDAKAIGIGEREDYRSFKSSGFGSVSDFLSAKRGGFNDPSEYRLATGKGFASKVEYTDFLKSGATTKQEFQEIARKQALAAAEIAKCDEAPVESALNACMAALSLAKPGNPVLSRRFTEIGDYLTERRATLFELTTKKEEVASADGNDAAVVGTTTVSKTADAFLVELTSVQEALRDQQCGMAYLESNWKFVSKTCSSSTGETNSVISEIAAIANSNLQAEKQHAADKAERERVAAEAERTRIAHAAAVERSSALQTQLGDYAGSGGRFDNPLLVARAMVELRKHTGSENYEAIEQASLALEELVASEPDFQLFIDQSKRAAQIAAVNANASAEAEIRRIEAFIEDYVTRNILAPEVADLLTLQTGLAEARATANADVILNVRKKADEKLSALALQQALDEFVFADNAQQKADVEIAENGLAVTELNRALLTGDGRDILVLGNFSPSAPNLAINLVGDVTFTGGSALFCWQSGVSGLTVPVKLAVRALEAMGVDHLEDKGICPRDSLGGIDLVLVERSKLLADDILNVGGFIAGYEEQVIRQINAVMWSDVGAKTVEAKETAELVRSEVMGGARSGYGVVRFENDSLQICFAVPTDDESAHLELLASQNDILDLEFQGRLSTAVMGLERAFITAQRNRCAAIYADSSSLKMVLAGTDRIGLTVRMLPLWFDDADFASAQATIAAEQDQVAKTLNARRQDMERRKAAEEQEQQALAAQQAIDANTAEAVRARKTKELRANFGQEAMAAYNGLNDLGIAFFQNGASSQFSNLFPEGRGWAAKKVANGWRFTKYSGVLRDYGTADWKGRRTEVVLVEMTVDASNSVRGEYSKDCFTAGYLIDAEFGRLRDTFFERCGRDDVVSNWQQSRQFESRWSAN
jgi:peptidoglycan hydrolase-like protein with peptidoglycan-binding domain